jgi:hypothetical protein
MAARVLCFGTDDCNRSLVLRQVGYEVDRCPTLLEFRALIPKRADADAVLVSEAPSRDRREVVTLTRKHSDARLVLFNTSYPGADEGEFDLIVPPLMSPEEWLRGIAALIEESRALMAKATMIREQSAQLVRHTKITRQQSTFERERSAMARAKMHRVVENIKQKPEPSDKDQR